MANNNNYYIPFTLTSNYIIHDITRYYVTEMEQPGEITENYLTSVTSIIATSFIWNKFHDLISGQPLKLSVSCDNVRILLIY